MTLRLAQVCNGDLPADHIFVHPPEVANLNLVISYRYRPWPFVSGELLSLFWGVFVYVFALPPTSECPKPMSGWTKFLILCFRILSSGNPSSVYHHLVSRKISP